jgi:hypothetical protein
MIFNYFLRFSCCLSFILRTLKPKKIPSDMFTIPRAVKMKFGLVNTINPMKIPQNPAIRNNTVMIPSLLREGVCISDFDFMALLNIERINL